MSNIVARIGIYGDLHLHSRNYGAHINYPKETLHYLRIITELTESEGLTHLIGLGDLTFGRFHTLEYRGEVERELEKQYSLVNGQRYELKGNHDSASYGMTEYEYYVKKGLIRPAEHLVIGEALNISMLNYGEIGKKVIIPPDSSMWNVLLVHDYVKFEDTNSANFGNAIMLENHPAYCGLNLIVAGHIHHFMAFTGEITSQQGETFETGVIYPGCITRPAYEHGKMETVGHLVVITVTDDKEVKYEDKQIPLLSISECFSVEKLEQKEVAKAEKAEKQLSQLDISDIVAELNSDENDIGSPEEIIEGLQDIPAKYKKKAIELLKAASA